MTEKDATRVLMKLKRKRNAPRVGLQLEESTACREAEVPVNLLDSQV